MTFQNTMSSHYGKMKIGDRIKLIRCDDPYTKIKPLDKGTLIDFRTNGDGDNSFTQFWIKWDNKKGTLALIPEAGDVFEVIKNKYVSTLFVVDSDGYYDSVLHYNIESKDISEAVFETVKLLTNDIHKLINKPDFTKFSTNKSDPKNATLTDYKSKRTDDIGSFVYEIDIKEV